MKHTEYCECDSCASKLYSESYKTETCIMKVVSIEFISGGWYVNYTIYNNYDNTKRFTQWPISTWNKYAKINIDKFGKVE